MVTGFDFVLPYAILEALLNHNGKNLKSYLKMRPPRQFTMLDCHDGIPVKPDLNDLYRSEDARELVRICLERGANLSYVLSPEHKDPDGFDVHQIRCSYYSVLNADDDAYLAARAIQFFVPGIPQIYYTGLLAGENDREAVQRECGPRGRLRQHHGRRIVGVHDFQHRRGACGYTIEDAAADLGDSAITETNGLGGFAMAASAAIVQFVGGTPADATANSRRMLAITLGSNPAFTLPALNFGGTPAGIDARLVVDSGILPIINTGIAHKKAGVGQIGAGVTRAPMACFRQAVWALASSLHNGGGRS